MQFMPLHPRAQLFTFRVWAEPLGEAQVEMRMAVRHVPSGETRYFREWAKVASYVRDKLQAGDEIAVHQDLDTP